MSYSLRPIAESDMLAIAKYIAADKPMAARKWRRNILETCRMLGDFPELGNARDDIPADLRTFANGNYIIVFRRQPGGVLILRVVHGARDWPKLVR